MRFNCRQAMVPTGSPDYDPDYDAIEDFEAYWDAMEARFEEERESNL